MPKKKEEKQNQNNQRMFIREQIQQMNISNVEKDLLLSKWGQDIFKTEKEICKILNRKEII